MAEQLRVSVEGDDACVFMAWFLRFATEGVFVGNDVLPNTPPFWCRIVCIGQLEQIVGLIQMCARP